MKLSVIGLFGAVFGLLTMAGAAAGVAKLQNVEFASASWFQRDGCASISASIDASAGTQSPSDRGPFITFRYIYFNPCTVTVIEFDTTGQANANFNFSANQNTAKLNGTISGTLCVLDPSTIFDPSNGLCSNHSAEVNLSWTATANEVQSILSTSVIRSATGMVIDRFHQRRNFDASASGSSTLDSGTTLISGEATSAAVGYSQSENIEIIRNNPSVGGLPPG